MRPGRCWERVDVGMVPGRCQDGAGTMASALEGVWDAFGGGNGMFRTPSKRNVRESEIVLKTGQANLADKNNRQAKSSLFLVCKNKTQEDSGCFYDTTNFDRHTVGVSKDGNQGSVI